MCTTVLSWDPADPLPVVAAVVRDEFLGRATDPLGYWWPEQPSVLGGRDAVAGGTWCAIDTTAGTLAVVINGAGTSAAEPRETRGFLPLRALAGDRPPDAAALRHLDPFWLLVVRGGAAEWFGYDGAVLTHESLAPGLHVLTPGGADPLSGHPRALRWYPRFAGVPRPTPVAGVPFGTAWGDWATLLAHPGSPEEEDALFLLRHHEDRDYGTTAVTLVAARPGAARVDHRDDPRNSDNWVAVPTRTAA